MEIKEFLEFIITFIGIVGAFFVNKIATNNNKSFIDVLVYLILLSIIVWGVSLLLEKKIFDNNEDEKLKKFKFEQMVDGIWIEQYSIDGLPMYALIEIQFDKNTTKMNLKGTAYDSIGSTFANWNSSEIYTDDSRNNLLYVYGGQFQNTVLEGKGYGELNFSKIGVIDRFTTATGYFADKFSSFKPVSFCIDRLNVEQCKFLCGKDKPEFSKDKEKLIRTYHVEFKKNNLLKEQ